MKNFSRIFMAMAVLLLAALMGMAGSYDIFPAMVVGLFFSSLILLWTWRQTIKNLTKQIAPRLEDLGEYSFERLSWAKQHAGAVAEDMKKTKNALKPEHFIAIAKTLPKHSMLHYVNRDSLPDDFFTECEKNLEDDYIYLVVSNTGSPASEIISAITKTPFNHASISFDKHLRTIVSYNGGNEGSAPGLNQEKLSYFHQKADSAVHVYRLKATRAQKKKMLRQLRYINRVGSAYNLLGLVLRLPYKPNIMFCSQFVYFMLQTGGLCYFDSAPDRVKPMDFVQKDWEHRLEFYQELTF